MNRCKLWAISAVSLLWSSVAFAEEGHGGGASNPFAGDIGNAIWTTLIFVLVLVVLGKFAWGPILSALQKREDFIRESLEKAKQDRDEAQRVLKEYSDRISAARAEATGIVDEGRRDADAVRHKIEEQTKSEAQAMLERAKREIGIARDTAVKEIYTHSAKLAVDMASRIMRKELNGKEHERLISESIDEIEQAVPR
jgi:F-type H+-transporting ATPase subunit b